MVNPGVVVVDVGISRIKGPDGKRLTVAFDEVKDVAGHNSPVPGGVVRRRCGPDLAMSRRDGDRSGFHMKVTTF